MSADELASTLAILERLVGFDTTSHNSNAALIDDIAAFLSGHGIAAVRLSDPKGAASDKFNLFACIGPQEAPGGIGLSGHTDVVPVTGQDWGMDPFRLTRREGRLYGRGTTDMKGFLACMLGSVARFRAAPLKRPIHLYFSYDEEIGCIGVRPMLARFGQDLPRPEIVFVGEPTGMSVVDAHKGPARWEVDVTGRAVHSSMAHLGVNAVEVAAGLVGELRHIAADIRETSRDARFTPPYSTLQVTGFSGGTATNIIPPSCNFRFEVRSLPGLDIAEIEDRLRAHAEAVWLPEMRAVAPEADIAIRLVNYVPPFGARDGSAAVSLARQLTGHNDTAAVSYATEAGLFQAAGADTVVCGPGYIDQAHTANEWIAEDELTKCLAFMARLSDWASR